MQRRKKHEPPVLKRSSRGEAYAYVGGRKTRSMHRQHQRPACLSVDDLHLDPNGLATLLLVLRFLQ